MPPKRNLSGGSESVKRSKARKQSGDLGLFSYSRSTLENQMMAAGNQNISPSSPQPDASDEFDMDDTSIGDIGSDIEGINELHAAALNNLYPDMDDGWATSDYWGDLPGFNPFWFATMDEDKQRVKRARYNLANHLPPNRPIAPLTLLGKSRLKGEFRHQDDGLRVYAARVFFRNLRLDDSDIGDQILNNRFETDTALAETWRKKAMGWQSEWQGHMLGYMLTSVSMLTQIVGTPELWKSSDIHQRHELFSRYYDCDPKYTAHRFFFKTYPAVDFHGIFANADPDRAKWQNYMKNVFCWTAEDTFTIRLNMTGPTNPNNTITAMASNFRQMAWSEHMDYLKLGDLDQLPVSKTGALDTQKRAMLLPPIIPSGKRVLAE